jgi:hypothetical protein
VPVQLLAVASEPPDLVVRVVGAGDISAVAALRSLQSAGVAEEPDFERRMVAWFALEGDRRTTWLATLAAAPVGMASVFEVGLCRQHVRARGCPQPWRRLGAPDANRQGR